MSELKVFNELQKLGFKSGDRIIFDGNILSFKKIEEEPPSISFYNCDFTKEQLTEIQKNPDRVKPKTVKFYVATVQRSCATKEHFEKFLTNDGFTIIGDIEEREVVV